MLQIENPVSLAAASLRKTAEEFERHVGRLAGLLAMSKLGPFGQLALAVPVVDALRSAAAAHVRDCAEFERLIGELLTRVEVSEPPRAMPNPRAAEPCGSFLLSTQHLPLPICVVCGWRESNHARSDAPDRTRGEQK